MPLPEQAAADEQAERQAAFERARHKLASVRSARPAGRTRLSFSDWMVIWLVGLGFIVFFIGAPLATYLFVPGANDPAQWSSNLDLPLSLFGAPVCFILIALISFRRKQREEAELLVVKFFAHLGLPSKPTDMAEHVIVEDLDDAPRRPAPFHSYVLPPSALHSPKDVDDYWKVMKWYDGKSPYRLDVEDSRLVPVAPDLVQAHLDIAVRRNTWVRWIMPFLLLTLAMMFNVALKDHGGLFGSKVLGSSLLFLCAGGVFLFLRRFRAKPVATLSVRKLLVNRAGEWKLFNGEWEGWEEADLSWLDDPGVGEIATYPVSSPAPRA